METIPEMTFQLADARGLSIETLLPIGELSAASESRNTRQMFLHPFLVINELDSMSILEIEIQLVGWLGG